VSTDAGNVAKLGTDGRIVVQPADMDSRFVNVTGDTMTGNLTVSATGDRIVAVTSTSAGSASLNVTSGANTGQVSQSGTTLFITNYPSGGILALTQAGAGSIRFTVNSVIPFQVTPTGVSVSGNITSTGTAHNFAANSITASAIAGLPAASTVAGAALAATAAVGTSTAYARADHSHSLPTAAQVGALTQADGDARYVNVTGDTMTGTLLITSSTTAVEARVQGFAGAGAQVVAQRHDDSVTGPFFQLHKGRGTSAAPTGVLTNDVLGTVAWVTRASTGPINSAQIAVTATGPTTAANTPVQMNFSVSDGTAAVNTVLSVRPAGVSILGNITSTGTAHNFAANSITASAILGLPAASAVAGADLAATGVVGVSAAYARADHSHPLPTAAQVGALTQADADLRFVNVTGDTVTGDLVVNGKLGVGVTPSTGFHVRTSTILLDGFVSSQGSRFTAPVGYGGSSGPSSSVGVVISDTRSTTGACIAFHAQTNGTALNPAIPESGDFAFLSEGPAPSRLGGDLDVQGNLIGERPFIAITGSRTLTLADRSANLANVSTGTAAVTITLPTNAAAAFPVGSRIEVFDLSGTAPTVVAAPAGVSLTWNATLTGNAPAVAGGVAASIQLQGPISRITVIKTATDSWMALV
jgi:hypothetical protein